MNEKAAVTALAALAQEARLRVFRALVGAGPQGMTPSALSAMLDIPGSTLSFHLKELVHADLVTVERDGRNLHYRPSPAASASIRSCSPPSPPASKATTPSGCSRTRASTSRSRRAAASRASTTS